MYNGNLCNKFSSIGMAKAALEAVSGFNVFGSEGDHSTVLFVDIDAHSRNRIILTNLLPRESASKVNYFSQTLLEVRNIFRDLIVHSCLLYRGLLSGLTSLKPGTKLSKEFSADFKADMASKDFLEMATKPVLKEIPIDFMNQENLKLSITFICTNYFYVFRNMKESKTSGPCF